jgi:hypothetical protein
MSPGGRRVHDVDVVHDVDEVDDVDGSGQANQRVGGDPRLTVSTRLSRAGVVQVDQFAVEEQRTRSAMLRILIAEAVAARRRKRRGAR